MHKPFRVILCECSGHPPEASYIRACKRRAVDQARELKSLTCRRQSKAVSFHSSPVGTVAGQQWSEMAPLYSNPVRWRTWSSSAPQALVETNLRTCPPEMLGDSLLNWKCVTRTKCSTLIRNGFRLKTQKFFSFIPVFNNTKKNYNRFTNSLKILYEI